MAAPDPDAPMAGRVTVVTAGASVILLAALVAVYVVYDSQLALAQAADSFVDVCAALGLWWAVRVGARPPDEQHPFGHHAAESIAALGVAMLAAVLAFEVGADAVVALLSGGSARFEWPLAGAFALKVVAKVGLFAWARHVGRREDSPAVAAIAVDARNDVLVGAVGLVGFFVARAGWPALDALLALPVAAWVGYAGFDLGLENVRRLMGEAPEEERQEELRTIAAGVPGVRDVGPLQARAHGTRIELWVEVRVDGELSVREGHDLGEAVEARLLEEPDVTRAVVHVDVA